MPKQIIQDYPVKQEMAQPCAFCDYSPRINAGGVVTLLHQIPIDFPSAWMLCGLSVGVEPYPLH